jgi:hypothetical protein
MCLDTYIIKSYRNITFYYKYYRPKLPSVEALYKNAPRINTMQGKLIYSRKLYTLTHHNTKKLDFVNSPLLKLRILILYGIFQFYILNNKS